MSRHYEEIWRFETARFAIVAEVTPCEDDPADSFQFAEDIAMVREERVAWFDARVRVLLVGDDGQEDDELGAGYLGCCAYDDPADLFRHHASLTRELRQLRGKTDAKSRKARKALKEVLANNIQAKPPVIYCEYGPAMVREAIADARRNVAKIAGLELRNH